MPKLKIACIGAGYFAQFHVAAWKRIPEVELVMICDQDLSKAEMLASKHDVKKVTTKIEDIWTDRRIDVVDIITPPDTHLELVTEATTAGKKIICQKPLAPSIEEAARLVQLVKERKVPFMVHENFRFQPWYRKLKELIADGAIGDKIHQINLRMRMGDGWSSEAYLDRQPYFREMERLLIYETGIHYIDVFRFLLGDIHSVFAKLRHLNKNIKGEDSAVVILEFNNGALGVLDGNRYNEANYEDPRFTFGETVIEGDGGTLRLYGDGKITLQKLGKKEQEIEYRYYHRDFAGDCVYFTQQHFVDCLQSGSDFETNGPYYLENLVVQEAIYQSAKLNRPVDIK